MTKEKHFTARQLVGLPGMPGTVMGAMTKAAREGWRSRKRAGRGGGKEYPIAALPAVTQAALAREVVKHNGHAVLARAPANDAQAEALAAHFEARPEKRKQAARRQLAIVQEYRALIERGFKQKAARAAVADKSKVSGASVWRWWKRVRKEPVHLWLYRLGGDHRGRPKRVELPAPAWAMLKADYLRLERPTAKACIDRLRRASPEHQWSIPSYKTLLRRLRTIPRAVTVAARDGAKELMKLYPAQQRNKSALTALQIINGDGYKHNVWVEFPDGEVRRAQTWFWQDVHSSKLLGFRTDKTEHTEVIRLSFGDIVERYGIPDQVLIDNTHAAANKTMTGGVATRYRFKVRDEEPFGVFPLLNVDLVWATPGHGQAKPIERAFGTGGIGEIVDKAPEFSGAWTGPNPLEKPDYDGVKRAVTLAQLEAVIEREMTAWNAQAGRRSPVHQGRSFDEVFDLSYNAVPVRRATEAQRRLWLLAIEPVRAKATDGSIALEAGRIRRDEIGPTQANRYWSPPMVDFAGQLLAARFDPKRLHEGVHVYTHDGRYVCFAQCFAPAGFNDANAGREHNRNRRIYMRAQKQQLESTTRMDTLQVAKHLPGAERAPADLTIRAPKVVRVEFRSPLAAPVPEPAPMTADERADMDSFIRDFNKPAPGNKAEVIEMDDPLVNYRRWVRLDRRIGAGEVMTDDERTWHRGYRGSAEWRAMERMAEDFPQFKEA